MSLNQNESETATETVERLPIVLPQRVPESPGWAMFIDLDGTLCPYTDSPEDVRLCPAQRDMLCELAVQLDGALCIISGRCSADLDRILWSLPIPRRAEHGRDRPGCLPDYARDELQQADQAMRAFASLFEHDGVWVESKATSCAIHYRRAPHLAERLIQAMRDIARNFPDLRVMEGHCLVELASPHGDKGRALREMMAEAPFRNRVPVALGDDLTDEDAFRAADALGGFGVAVGERHAPSARYRLADCAAVNRWLHKLMGATGEVPHV